MRLPTYDEIARDEQQLEIYMTLPSESIFAVGPPGSGKTILAVHRAQLLAKAGHSVALVTFNRMLRRLIVQLMEGHLVKASTMHRYAYDHYRDIVGNKKIPHIGDNRFNYDWEKMSRVLRERGVEPKGVHLVVDEGQDLPAGFFRYVRDFVASHLTVFADEDQAFTEMCSSLSDIMQAARLPDPFLLNTNHRNTPEISRVAAHFHTGSIPVPDVRRPRSGELPRVVAWLHDTATERIVNTYTARGGRVGVAVVQNGTGRRLRGQLRKRLPRLKINFYTNSKKNEDDFDLVNPGITILNVRSIKGQEFDTVFIMEIDILLRNASEVDRRHMYMLCSRARDYLTLVYNGVRLPTWLLEQLPGADILERP